MRPAVFVATLLFSFASLTYAKPRARDLGIPFAGEAGSKNAITDVKGVEVGFSTLVRGEGTHAVRTGVTAVFPKGKKNSKVPAATFSLNGNGEMTGTAWIEESGFLEGPVMLTNTYSVGTVRDSLRAWGEEHFPNSDPDADDAYALPVVAETWDGLLNDIKGFHVKKEDVYKALDSAKGGEVAEGAVGGGTGMVCFQFKCGTGTASRKVRAGKNDYKVGVLVQANFGRRPELAVAGVKLGSTFPDLMPVFPREKKDGSLITVVATDAPLLPSQLRRLAKRVTLGMANTGGISRNSSGDLFLAFSTVEPKAGKAGNEAWEAVPNGSMDELFRATIQATEEAIVNALVAGETMTGVDGNKVFAIPHDRLKEALRAGAPAK